MTKDEKSALNAEHRHLHHHEDVNSEWAWSALRKSRWVVERSRRLRMALDDIVIELDDDDMNQLKRVLEYAKFRPYTGNWDIRMTPMRQYLPEPYGGAPFPSSAFASSPAVNE
jgi:hypothetical protein